MELYRGNVLLDFRQDDGSGRFRFDNVPLLIGNNEITLRFYGPQGQVREVVRPLIIGNQMVTPGEWITRFGIVDQGQNLFTDQNTQTRASVHGIRVFLEASHGLSKDLTFRGSLNSFEGDRGRETFVKAGLRGAYFGASERLDLIADDEGLQGFQFGILHRLYGVDAQYDHVEFFDFKTDLEPNLSRRDKLRLSGTVGRIFLEGSAEAEVDRQQRTRYEYLLRTAGHVSGVTVTNLLNVNQGNFPDRFRGELLVSGRVWPDINLQSGVDYEFTPRAGLRDITARLDYRYSEDMTLRLSVIQNFIGEDEFSVSAGFLWNTARADWGLTGTYSTERDFQLVASLTFSLSPDASDDYYVHRLPNSDVARVETRVFIDRNRDGIYDSDQDELLEDVRLERKMEESGKDGIAALRLQPYRTAQIKINEETLPDPYLVTPPEFTLRARPGLIAKVDIPVWETGEIEGMARPGEPVKLINKKGHLIAIIYAEFDGFYLFEKVFFGTYNVRYGGNLLRAEISREHPVARAKMFRPAN